MTIIADIISEQNTKVVLFLVVIFLIVGLRYYMLNTVHFYRKMKSHLRSCVAVALRL